MENNKLIAEFMGLPLVPCSIGTENGIVYEGYQHPKGGTPFTADGLQYKYSWDWLMPVVDKCLSQSDDTMLEQWTAVRESLSSCNIDEVYEAVVKFVSYNKYPFNEGDDYWVVEDGQLVWGVWDDASEEMHDEDPKRKYFTEEEAIDYARAYGITYNK
tara:strand:+ start:403 stop:876 length:474 start_codon:yes stop_codon:yes gene_type:complete